MTRSSRKDQHLDLALKQKEYIPSLDKIQLIHQSLPEFDLNDVSLATTFLGREFELPLYINAMTGGSNKTGVINQKLARFAKKYRLPMAVGSQHAALEDATLVDSFRVVRNEYPEGFIIGNVSANADVQTAKAAIEMVHANALGIHINVAQELTMAEGDRKFAHWSSNIQNIAASVSVPVIVKEVGNGMSAKTVSKLIALGVKNIDVGGKGGTNFVQIENRRREHSRHHYLENWGILTADSLLMNQENMKKTSVFASGGIQTPLDVVKALVLGAKAVGMSATFLRYVVDEKEDEFADFIEDMKKIMLMVGAQNVDALRKVEYVVV